MCDPYLTSHLFRYEVGTRQLKTFFAKSILFEIFHELLDRERKKTMGKDQVEKF